MKQCISLKNTNYHNVRNAISDRPDFYKGVIHIANLTLNFSAKLRGLVRDDLFERGQLDETIDRFSGG
jgi:hypothetical protein